MGTTDTGVNPNLVVYPFMWKLNLALFVVVPSNHNREISSQILCDLIMITKFTALHAHFSILQRFEEEKRVNTYTTVKPVFSTEPT